MRKTEFFTRITKWAKSSGTILYGAEKKYKKKDVRVGVFLRVNAFATILRGNKIKDV